MSKTRPWNTPLSSLVVTLSSDPERAAVALRALGEHPSIELGAQQANYLPLVIEDTDARPIHAWLESLDGVLNVDVAFCSTEHAPVR